MAKFIKTITEDWGGRPRTIRVMRCDCGEEIECVSWWSNECDCGTEYNGAGQALAPRSQWGEETGETF